MKGDRIKSVLEAIAEIQPATASELSELLRLEQRLVVNVLSKLRLSKRIYVSDWIKEYTKEKGLTWWKVYRLGNRPEKPKPKPMGNTERCNRYRQRLKSRTNNSVFNFGLTLQQRQALVRVSTS